MTDVVDALNRLSERLDRIERRFVEAPPQPSPFLDYDEAAAYLRCSRKTLQNAKARGLVTAAAGGPGVCFTREELDRHRATFRPAEGRKAKKPASEHKPRGRKKRLDGAV